MKISGEYFWLELLICFVTYAPALVINDTVVLLGARGCLRGSAIRQVAPSQQGHDLPSPGPFIRAAVGVEPGRGWGRDISHSCRVPG